MPSLSPVAMMGAEAVVVRASVQGDEEMAGEGGDGLEDGRQRGSRGWRKRPVPPAARAAERRRPPWPRPVGQRLRARAWHRGNVGLPRHRPAPPRARAPVQEAGRERTPGRRRPPGPRPPRLRARGQHRSARDQADPRGTERIGRLLLPPERRRSLSPAAGKEERQIWGTGGRVRRGAARGGRIPARPANGGEGKRRPDLEARGGGGRRTRKRRQRPSRQITRLRPRGIFLVGFEPGARQRAGARGRRLTGGGFPAPCCSARGSRCTWAAAAGGTAA